jgi:hypothetical protein
MSIGGGDSHRKTASIKEGCPDYPCATDCIEGPGSHSFAPMIAIGCLAGLGCVGAWVGEPVGQVGGAAGEARGARSTRWPMCWREAGWL